MHRLPVWTQHTHTITWLYRMNFRVLWIIDEQAVSLLYNRNESHVENTKIKKKDNNNLLTLILKCLI